MNENDEVYKLKHNPPEELVIKTSEMAKQVIKNLIKHCPKHKEFPDRDIVFNILIQSCVFFLIGSIRTHKDALNSAEGMFALIKSNINDYFEYQKQKGESC